MRKALLRLLKSHQLNACAFATAHEFLAHGVTGRPACLVLDVRLPGLSGLDLQQELERRNTRVPVIFITGHGDVRMSVQAMKRGAVDFLLKPFNQQDLMAVVRQALTQDQRAHAAHAHQTEFQRRLHTLTPRERQVFDRVIQGLLNKQIASELGASEQTIKVHRHRVMEKMGVTSVAELVQAAMRGEVLGP